MIIGINGRLGSGKDLTAKIIQYLVTNNSLPEFSHNLFEYYQKLDSKRQTELSGIEIKKFAAKLKQIVSLLTGCTVDDLESQEFKTKQIPGDWNSLTYRYLLQKIGTEAMRNCVHEDIWVNAAFSNYDTSWITSMSDEQLKLCNYKYPNYVFTDMRFPNEMNAIKQRGGITIRIKRYKDITCSEHISETALDNEVFDYEIENNGTIEELIGKIKLILIKENIINGSI